MPHPVLDLIARFDAALLVAGGDRGPGGEEPVRGLIPRPVQPVVERAAAIGQLHRPRELAVMRHDVGEVVTAARLQVDVVDRVGQFGRRGDVVAGELEVDPSMLRSTPRAAARRRGPARGRVAGGIECRQDPLRAPAVAEHDPGPAEAVDDVEREQRVVRRRSRPARRRCWRARLGRRRDARPWRSLRTPGVDDRGRVREPCGVRGEGALGQPGIGHRFEREGADAVEQPVADRGARPRRRR